MRVLWRRWLYGGIGVLWWLWLLGGVSIAQAGVYVQSDETDQPMQQLLEQADQQLDFEDYIVDYLTKHDYIERFNENYSVNNCFDVELLISFIKESQEDKWNYLIKKTGNNAEKEFVKTLHRRLNNKSTIHVLRNELSVFGIRFNLFYSKPYNNLNPDLSKKYHHNIFSVIKELKYEDKDDSNRVDLVIFLNGIPIITIELKDTFNQGVQDAINQYKYDRDSRELLFKRCLVHFAMSDEKIHMTTKLDGSKTIFLPFNKDITNPDVENDYRTSYMYREILQTDQLINLVNNFIFKEDNKIIFPRYHQLDCVNLLLGESAPGKNFLIQHSAGSGKTKTIAWLADGLKNLFNKNDERIYDMILVVSDRRVIDGQLQEQVKAIEKKAGVVEVIDENSNQLAESLITGNNIVVTTLHKFSYILDKVKDLPDRKYAIIIDEAHSSQSGSYARNLRTALSNKKLTEEDIDLLDDELGDGAGEACFALVDLACQKAYSEDELRKEVTKSIVGEYKELEFEKVDKKEFEIDGKDRKCEGYKTEITEDNVVNILEKLEEVLQKESEDINELMEELTGTEVSTDELIDELIDEMDFSDIELTFYIYKKELACIVVEVEKEEVEILFTSEDNEEVISLVYDDETVMELILETEGNTETYTMETMGMEYGVIEYDYKSGNVEFDFFDGEIEGEGLIESSAKEKSFEILELDVDGEDMGTGRVFVRSGADMHKFSGEKFDLGNASESDFEDLAEELMEIVEMMELY